MELLGPSCNDVNKFYGVLFAWILVVSSNSGISDISGISCYIDEYSKSIAV